MELYNEGVDLAKAGDPQAATEKMLGALAADPTFVDGYIVLGKLHAQTGTTTGLEQAVTCWQCARTYDPTAEQIQKLDNCIDAAQARIYGARSLESAGRGMSSARIGVGVLGLVLVCFGVGCLLPQVRAMFIGSQSSAENVATHKPVRGSALAVPVSEVNQALKRTDASVTGAADRIALKGRVQSNSEKAVAATGAAVAARKQPAQVDGIHLTGNAAHTPIAANRVEHTLRLLVDVFGQDVSALLHGARISVSGGENRSPLKVTGSCGSREAASTLARLVKEIYPSVNTVDTSGLVVARVPRESVHVSRHVTDVGRLPVESRDPATWSTRVAASPSRGGTLSPADPVYVSLTDKAYTVLPGDTIVAITHKFGRQSTQWQELWKANRKAIRNPNEIPAGTVLKLPPGWSAAKRPGADNE